MLLALVLGFTLALVGTELVRQFLRGDLLQDVQRRAPALAPRDFPHLAPSRRVPATLRRAA